MKPHAGQLSVVLFQHVANSVEPLVELVQQRLVLGVVGPLRHHIHVVEGEELELGTDEVVLAGLSGHDVCQLESIPHLGGPIQTDSQQAEEEHNHNHLETEDGASSINVLHTVMAGQLQLALITPKDIPLIRSSKEENHG